MITNHRTISQGFSGRRCRCRCGRLLTGRAATIAAAGGRAIGQVENAVRPGDVHVGQGLGHPHADRQL